MNEKYTCDITPFIRFEHCFFIHVARNSWDDETLLGIKIEEWSNTVSGHNMRALEDQERTNDIRVRANGFVYFFPYKIGTDVWLA